MPIAEENQIVQVVLTREQVKEIDKIARTNQRRRSDFLRILILDCLPRWAEKSEPESTNTALTN